MRVRAWLGGLVIGAALGCLPAHAQKAQDTLRIAWRDAIPNVDFYYNSLRTGLIVSHHVWDTLIYRDPETFQLKPLLATSWKYVDETSVEFELRPGVVFHDGSKFTADDVVYTVNLVLNDKQISVPSNFSFIDGVEKVDDLHVRIRLKRVFPAALEYFAMVLPIYPKPVPGAGRRGLLQDAGGHRSLQDHQGRWRDPDRHGNGTTPISRGRRASPPSAAS